MNARVSVRFTSALLVKKVRSKADDALDTCVSVRFTFALLVKKVCSKADVVRVDTIGA